MPFISPGFVHLHKWFRWAYKRKGFIYPGETDWGGGLKPEQKKRFETRNRIVDKNTFCILFYWILFKLQNVKINQVYFNALRKELISERAYNQMCFFAYRYSEDGPITGVGGGGEGLASSSLWYCILWYRPKTNLYIMIIYACLPWRPSHHEISFSVLH